MVSIIVTVALAFIGYFATYFNNLRIAQRKDRLDLVNRQLYDFYGPLYVSAKVGQIAFQAFLLKNNLPQNFIFGLTPPLTTALSWRSGESG